MLCREALPESPRFDRTLRGGSQSGGEALFAGEVLCGVVIDRPCRCVNGCGDRKSTPRGAQNYAW